SARGSEGMPWMNRTTSWASRASRRGWCLAILCPPRPSGSWLPATVCPERGSHAWVHASASWLPICHSRAIASGREEARTVPESPGALLGPRPLEGREGLITGAAHNIGRAITLAYAESGADVVVHAHKSGDAAEA